MMIKFKFFERENYNITRLHVAPWSTPPNNGTLAHRAMTYEIDTLLENNIDIIITTPIYHPDYLSKLSIGQWDGFNETVDRYRNVSGITVFDLTWDVRWIDEHFFNRNHLDDDGRFEYCHQLAPVIEQVLNKR